MKPLIIGNWKCNPQTHKEAREIFEAVAKEVKGIRGVEIVICLPFIYIGVRHVSDTCLTPKIGGQDCFWEQKGAFTGEISPAMLKDIGCRYVIVGHSERRKYFKETNEIVNKKLKAVLEVGLVPIFCIGETQEEREADKTEIILKEQLTKGLVGISNFKFQISNLAIAYEPVWAIGTGNPCSVEESQRMRLYILKVIAKIYSQNIAKRVKLLYGGSVNSQNSAGYIKEAGFNGLLVGGASLNPEEFGKIIKSVT